MLTMKQVANTAFAAFFALLCANDRAQAATSWRTYRNAHDGYAISYPPGWRIDTGHVYSALGPGKEIRGVAFMVSKNFTAGTNLSDSSYLAVEILPDATQCSASAFLDDAIDKPRMVTGSHGITWSVQDGSDAGAGNIYEETVQAVIGARPCIATRAFAHSTNIGNYDPGTVKAFDRAAFNATIDRMRRSFRLLPR